MFRRRANSPAYAFRLAGGHALYVVPVFFVLGRLEVAQAGRLILWIVAVFLILAAALLRLRSHLNGRTEKAVRRAFEADAGDEPPAVRQGFDRRRYVRMHRELIGAYLNVYVMTLFGLLLAGLLARSVAVGRDPLKLVLTALLALYQFIAPWTPLLFLPRIWRRSRTLLERQELRFAGRILMVGAGEFERRIEAFSDITVTRNFLFLALPGRGYVQVDRRAIPDGGEAAWLKRATEMIP